jgi:3-hydroxyacyl-[acyl-carrier-protein] dehydratase
VTHRVRLSIPAEHPAFAGHFPGRPVLPGVLLLSEVIEAALEQPALAARLGAQPRVAVTKFHANVAPGAELELVFDAAGARIRFEARCGGRLAASGEFDAAPADPGNA